MPKNIYILTEYEYDTYSFSGITPMRTFAHATKEGAEKHAAELGLVVVQYCKNPSKEATVSEEALLE